MIWILHEKAWHAKHVLETCWNNRGASLEQSSLCGPCFPSRAVSFPCFPGLSGSIGYLQDYGLEIKNHSSRHLWDPLQNPSKTCFIQVSYKWNYSKPMNMILWLFFKKDIIFISHDQSAWLIFKTLFNSSIAITMIKWKFACSWYCSQNNMVGCLFASTCTWEEHWHNKNDIHFYTVQ